MGINEIAEKMAKQYPKDKMSQLTKEQFAYYLEHQDEIYEEHIKPKKTNTKKSSYDYVTVFTDPSTNQKYIPVAKVIAESSGKVTSSYNLRGVRFISSSIGTKGTTSGKAARTAVIKSEDRVNKHYSHNNSKPAK